MDVGVEFEHYRVIEHIGRGGMADVWSARDKRLNRVVAVKTMARDLTLESDPVKMFEQEARTIAALEHPHILPIYDFGDYERQLYIVMRYIAGGSLDDVLDNGPMPLDEALSMARMVATALDHAHRSKVVHLDLKPSNILLDSQGQPYLADFGLASVMDKEGRALNPGSGTLLYMAPEQVTSDLLDHRADIYSFCILLFHIFTGTLPFDGTMPLALQQLQMADELPDLSSIQLGLPFGITLALRRGTQVDIDSRPSSVMEIVDELEALFNATPVSISRPATVERVVAPTTVDLATMPLGGTSTLPLDTADALARREAMEIYNKARRAWASGQGRFTLGITDFTLINDYYSAAEQHNLALDEAGTQMLLRGALEYDYEIEFWWNKLPDESRRWVALHAVRGQNAAARVRALHLLEDVTDSDPPQIPKLVAQALQMENNAAAKAAAIALLAKRSQMQSNTPSLNLGTQTGALSQTASIWLTRRLKLWTPGEWRESVYGAEIDTVLANLALDASDSAAAEAAARAIGTIRSEAGLKRIAAAQQAGERGALRALALIRDEAPSLPGVSAQARTYAWWANTWRRITADPLQLVYRFIWAFLGAGLGMALYAWSVLDQLPLLDAQRLKETVSLGLFFGLFAAVLVVLAGELPARMRGFWTWWARLLVSAVIAIPLATFLWSLYTYMFLQYTPQAAEEWQPLILAGIGLALGLILASVYRLPSWLMVVITAVTTYIPLYIAHVGNIAAGTPAVIYTRPQQPEQIFSLIIPVVILIALGVFGLALWRELRGAWARLRGGSAA
jgi:serine/threonine protein kinase